MWHASVSLQKRRAWVDDPARAERLAVAALAGVGGEVEWWRWNPAAHVGHLRVPVTVAELVLVPAGCVVMDAGETGPRRARTV